MTSTAAVDRPTTFVPSSAVTAAAAELCRERGGQVLDGQPCPTCVRTATIALEAGLRAIDPDFATGEHVLIVTTGSWSIAHPLACRVGGLHTCPTTGEMQQVDDDLIPPPGRYALALDEQGDPLIDGINLMEWWDRQDAAEAAQTDTTADEVHDAWVAAREAGDLDLVPDLERELADRAHAELPPAVTP